MKKINSSFCCVSMLLICFFSVQTVSAIDVPLKKDPIGTGTMRMTRTLSVTSTSVSADLVGTELIVDFSTPVGTAYISIVDAAGNVVSLTAVDTFTSPEAIIYFDGFGIGNYSLLITYGTTKLSGTFSL